MKRPLPLAWGDRQERALEWLGRLRSGCVFLDTETTGFAKPGDDPEKPYGDQVVEIAVYDRDCALLYHAYVERKVDYHPDARAILRRAHFDFDGPETRGEAWQDVLDELAVLVGDRAIVAWNSSFDRRLIQQTSALFGVKTPKAGQVQHFTYVEYGPKYPLEYVYLKRTYLDTKLARASLAERKKTAEEELYGALATEEEKESWLDSVRRRMTHEMRTLTYQPTGRLKRRAAQVFAGKLRASVGLEGWIDAMGLYGALRGHGTHTKQAKAAMEEGYISVTPDEASLFYELDVALQAEEVEWGEQAHGARGDALTIAKIFAKLDAEFFGTGKVVRFPSKAHAPDFARVADRARQLQTSCPIPFEHPLRAAEPPDRMPEWGRSLRAGLTPLDVRLVRE